MTMPPWPPRAFAENDLEALVPPSHLLRRLEECLDFTAVEAARRTPNPLAAGRPQIDPEILFRMIVLAQFYGIDSDRYLCDEIQVNLAFRWFIGLTLADSIPDHSTLSRFRRRLGRELFDQVMDELSTQLKAFNRAHGRLVSRGA